MPVSDAFQLYNGFWWPLPVIVLLGVAGFALWYRRRKRTPRQVIVGAVVAAAATFLVLYGLPMVLIGYSCSRGACP